MRLFYFLSFCTFCGVAPILAANHVQAQVSVNLKALDTLDHPAAPSARVAPVPERPRAGSQATPLPLPPLPSAPPLHVPHEEASLPNAATALPAPPPQTPPPPPVIAPVVLVGPPHPEPVPPPPAVAAGAPGLASAIPDGIRVTFGTREATLNPMTLAALRKLAAAAAHTHAPAVNVEAYAPEDTSDPSTPRRLSLARALAARAIFREAGIPSEKIYVRALLAEPAGKAPANRVDVTVTAAARASR